MKTQDIWFLLLISAIKAQLRFVGDTKGFRIAKKLKDTANTAQVNARPYQKKEQDFM